MIGHLGSRVSALLDGQLDPAEEERAWAHVHACHQCRDLVEREGWVKTRLAGLSGPGVDGVSPRLRGTLREPLAGAGRPAADPEPWARTTSRHRAGLAALGGGAVGAAVVGVLALGLAPAETPLPNRRAPLTDLSSVRQSPTPTPSSTAAPTPGARTRGSVDRAPDVRPGVTLVRTSLGAR